MDAMDGVGLGAPGETATARTDFGAFFTQRHRELALLAYEQSGQRVVAEEITADAFAEAWRRWEEISRSDSPAAAMREVVDRLAEGRVRRSPAGQPQDPYEPDAARIWDLTSERIALIPRQKKAAAMLAAGGAGIDDGARRTTTGGNGRFRRPGPIGIVIGVNAIAAVVAIVVAATTVGSSGHDNHVTVSLAETNTVKAQGTEPDSPNQAAAATGYTPSHSASASASPSPTADQPTNTNSALASTSATASVAANAGASPSVSATTSPVSNAGSTSSADLLTASGSVNVYSSATWTQLDVAADITQTLSAMTITIQVADCTDLAETGEWDSGADGEFNPTSTTNANGSITYRFQLVAGDEATPGDVSFAVQFSHTATGWSASADSYSVTATSAASGANDDLGGGF